LDIVHSGQGYRQDMQAERSASGPAARPEYLPLERYGLIGECGTAALVSDDGSIDWLPMPRFDADPIFARILDPDAGHFHIRPREPFTSVCRYLPDTPILATTFSTASGRATLYDFFAAERFEKKRRELWPFRYLVRRLEGEEGTMEFDVEIAPRASFGTSRLRVRSTGYRVVADRQGRAVFFACSAPFEVRDDTATARISIDAGATAHVTASDAGDFVGILPPVGEYADRAFHQTLTYWKEWSESDLLGEDAPEVVRRSAIVLKLLSYAPSGSMVAAPTTSLPEAPGHERNWDYRYVWLRDASRTTEALFDLGHVRDAHAYMHWITNAAHLSGPRIETLYGPHGEHWIDERDIPNLRGYLDSRPVRKGNGAGRQLQLDNWGEVIDAAATYAERTGHLRPAMWRIVRSLVRFVADHWREPDHGIWEMRGEPKQFVHSKMMCWVALDRAIRLCHDLDMKGPVEDWERERDAVHREVLERGFDAERNTFTQVFDEPRLDAALLEIPIYGFLPGEDPRVTGTIDAVRRELGRGELLYRYHTDDELSGSEGAFLACSFWLVQALVANGRQDEAREVFDAVVARANPLGLLPEEIDPGTGAFLGNYPQGLTHIALVNAAAALRDPERMRD
jgi:GH15 family glucan-1,4-alpha-glucosidase